MSGRLSSVLSRQRKLLLAAVVGMPGRLLVLLVFAVASSNDLSVLSATEPQTVPSQPGDSSLPPDSVPVTTAGAATTGDPASQPDATSQTGADPDPGDPDPGDPDATPTTERGASSSASLTTSDSNSEPATSASTSPDVTAPSSSTPSSASSSSVASTAGTTAEGTSGDQASSTTVAATTPPGGDGVGETLATSDLGTTGAQSSSGAGGTGGGSGEGSADGEGSGDGGIGSLAARLGTAAVWGLLILGGVVLVLLVVGAIRSILSGWRPSEAADDDITDSDGPLVVGTSAARVGALDRLQRELEREPDPRQAIRKAYAIVEGGFGNTELARRQSESASDYLQRTLGAVEGSEQLLGELTALFMLARYSKHPISSDMRLAAIDAVVGLRSRYRLAEVPAA